MDGNDEILKAQQLWFKKVSHEVVGKPGEFAKEISDQLQREGAIAARDRVERLEAQREAMNLRIDTAIKAEQSLIERLETKIAETLPETASDSASASASAAKTATKSKKSATTAKATAPRKAAGASAAKPKAKARPKKTSKPK